MPVPHVTTGETILESWGDAVADATDALEATAPAAGEKAALAGTSGAPGAANKYVTDTDARNTNARTAAAHAATHNGGGGDALAIDAAAATGSLRTLGAAATAAAAGNHAHAGALTDHTHEVAGPGATGGGATVNPTSLTLQGTGGGGGGQVNLREDYGADVTALDVSGASDAAEIFRIHKSGAILLQLRTDGTKLSTPSTQAFGDSAVIGTSDEPAWGDHKHGMPALGTTAAAIGTSAGGAAATPSKSDHVHATGAGTPSTQAFGDAAAVGAGPAAAMTDHKHAMPVVAALPGAIVDRTTNLAVATATAVSVTWPTETHDPDDWHSTATNTERVTVPSAGWYKVEVQINYDAAFAAAGRSVIDLFVNASGTSDSRDSRHQSNAGIASQSLSALLKLAANDYIYAQVYQVSGGTRNVQGRLSVVRLGSA